MAKQLVILLHGVGSRGADLEGLAHYWAPYLPDTLFAAPNAPVQVGAGYQWFNIAGITQENRPQRIADARAAFDAVLNQVLTEHDASFAQDHIVLVGFSQGAMMALDLLASGRVPVKAIVAFSGRLASRLPLTPLISAPALLIHGQQDPVVPWQESELAAKMLRAEGVRVETVYEPGSPHTISNAGAEKARDFLATLFGVTL